MMEGVQYDKGCAVRRRHTISTDPGTDAGVQYGSVTASVRRRHTFRADKDVLYRGVTPSVLSWV